MEATETDVSPWQRIKRLGRGATSDVWKTDINGEPRALKIATGYDPALYPAYLRTFQRELRTLQRIESPNVMKAYEVSDKPLYMVCQYLPGPSWDRVTKFLGLEARLKAVGGAIRGLVAIHAAGVIHRDIKPENIILSHGTSVIVDFGLSLILGETDAIKHPIVGTPRYMAPEVADGVRDQPTIDIYSLGCSIYTFLCGRPPYPGESAREVLAKHKHGHPTAPSVCCSSVPAALDPFILRAIENKPPDRYQNAGDMLSTFREMCSQMKEQP